MRNERQRSAEIEALLQRGKDWEAASNSEKALECFNLILEEHPHHVEALRLSGRVLFRLKRMEEARRYLEMALKYEPENDGIATLLAMIPEPPKSEPIPLPSPPPHLPKSETPMAVLVGVTVLLFILLIGWSVGRVSDGGKSPDAASRASLDEHIPVNSAANTEEIFDTLCLGGEPFRFDQFHSIMGFRSSATELQKDEVLRQLKREKMKVTWTGRIMFIDPERNGLIPVKVSHSKSTITWDVIVYFDANQRKKLIEVNKGDFITYMGEIESWGTLWYHEVKGEEILVVIRVGPAALTSLPAPNLVAPATLTPLPAPNLRDIVVTENSFDYFSEHIRTLSQLTEFQADVYRAEMEKYYIGQPVEWNGEVVQVKTPEFGKGPVVFVKHRESTWTWDVELELLPTEKEKALRVREGSLITYRGIFRELEDAVEANKLTDGILVGP